MKDFLPRTHFSEEHEMFRDMVRGFVEKEITPNVERWHNEGMPDREIFKKAGELGLIGMSTPEEYGNRNRGVVTPAEAANAIWVCDNSRARIHGGSSAMSGWVNVWTPISWPWSTMSLTIVGYRATWVPTTKNVPGTSCWPSTARICGVHSGLGPSSKVSTTVFGGSSYDAIR